MAEKEITDEMLFDALYMPVATVLSQQIKILSDGGMPAKEVNGKILTVLLFAVACATPDGREEDISASLMMLFEKLRPSSISGVS
jgi:hypothetical protein